MELRSSGLDQQSANRTRIFRAFVLAGGKSSRMGGDKALLEVGGVPMVKLMYNKALEAADDSTVVAPSGLYNHLDIGATIPDLVPGCGPIGGIHAALTHALHRPDTPVEGSWNIMVACDMPNVTSSLMREMLEAARAANATCLAARSDDGWHPLCAVYHTRALPVVSRAIDQKRLKMHDLLENLEVVAWPVKDSSLLANINTPEDWAAR